MVSIPVPVLRLHIRSPLLPAYMAGTAETDGKRDGVSKSDIINIKTDILLTVFIFTSRAYKFIYIILLFNTDNVKKKKGEHRSPFRALTNSV